MYQMYQVLQLVVINFAVDHGEDALGHVAEGMAVEDDHIGVLAGFQRTHFVLDAQELGRVDGDALEGFLLVPVSSARINRIYSRQKLADCFRK